MSKSTSPFDDERLLALYERVRAPLARLSPAKERRLWVRPKIPGVMLQRAVQSFAPEASQGRALVLCDATRLRTVRAGFLLTSAGFYCRSMTGTPKGFRHADLVGAVLTGEGDARTLSVETAAEVVTFTETDAQLDALKGLVTALVEARDLGLTENTARFIIVEHLPKPVRLAYVRAAIALGCDGATPADPRELAAAELLMTRLHFEDPLRAELRAAAIDVAEAADDLTAAVAVLDKSAPRGTEHGLWLSLLKDALAMARTTRPKAQLDELERGLELARRFEVTVEQAELIVTTVGVEELILANASADLAATVEELATRAASVQAPLQAAYLSGSTVGLSAPVIAEAFARLHLGGQLGTVALATGDHAFLAVSVGGADRVLERGRSYLLAEILATLQATIRQVGARLGQLDGPDLARHAAALDILLDRWEGVAESCFEQLEQAGNKPLPLPLLAPVPVPEPRVEVAESGAGQEEVADEPTELAAVEPAEPAVPARKPRRSRKKAASKPAP